VEFRLLGSLEVVADGTVAQLGSPKQRALLAVLLLHPGELIPSERLIELLWPEDPPRTAAHSIQIYVSELRKSLDRIGSGEVIRTRPPGYLLDTRPETVDAWRFERLVRDGLRKIEEGDAEAGRRTLREALALWRGPALSDFAYDEFAQPHIRRLNDLHLDAVEAFAAVALEGGNVASVVSLLEAAVREDPLRERSRELLMLSLYRSGRHAEALRTFEALRVQLRDELGVDPSPPVRRLYDRILLHDPALLPERGERGIEGTTRNPFKGLRSFRERDAGDFFGRDLLVRQMAERLGHGHRLISLVGPSGSGKSSVVAAGLIPRLRAASVDAAGQDWRVVMVTPGVSPLREAQEALRFSGEGGGRPGAARLPSSDTAATAPRTDALVPPDLLLDGPLLLVIDQFELVFELADEGAASRFLSAIAAAARQLPGQLALVLTLRADYYDRPLLHSAFAEVFIPSVINVAPMTPDEIEQAIVAPAQCVGVGVEPSLLAELVADTANRPGSLPLLQYALTELFDQRTEPMLTQAGYRAIGGLRGLLSRRAEELYLGMSPEAQHAAMQVFLRLVRSGRGPADSHRRLLLSELTDIGIDPVVLSELLTTFGRHRLLTFDREAASGQATVEIAHEALLVEWERLAGWIDRHRTALKRHTSLAVAAEEWELAGRHADYLLAGSRLFEFEGWLKGGVLQLTSSERQFLEASASRQRLQDEEREAHASVERRLVWRARTTLVGLVASVVLLGGVAAYGLMSGFGSPSQTVALFWWGGDLMWDQLETGFDRGVTEFGFTAKKIELVELGDLNAVWEDELRRLSDGGVDVIFVFDGRAEDLDRIAADYPNVRYVLLDQVGRAPNVAYLPFADAEGAFMAGAAAALTTRTGTIGFVGGTEWDVIWRLQAGYEAGARAADPQVRVLTEYLTAGFDFGGFHDAAGAEEAARRMYADGADVVFHAAGSAGLGVFEAAYSVSRSTGQHVWAIGVDSDEHETVLRLPGVMRPERWQPHILTSVEKRMDTAVYDVLRDLANGSFAPGRHQLDLASGHLGLSYSGGYLDELRAELESLEAAVIRDEIKVPCLPEGLPATRLTQPLPEYCPEAGGIESP
jgi:basic membrane lipoprotein Med (substrate-binding protein (PBP1-ABC) superfamily)/DNA-binding SARP family transcriptional activator